MLKHTNKISKKTKQNKNKRYSMFGINQFNFIFEKYYHMTPTDSITCDGWRQITVTVLFTWSIKSRKNSAAPSRGGTGVIMNHLPLCVSSWNKCHLFQKELKSKVALLTRLSVIVTQDLVLVAFLRGKKQNIHNISCNYRYRFIE